MRGKNDDERRKWGWKKKMRMRRENKDKRRKCG